MSKQQHTNPVLPTLGLRLGLLFGFMLLVLPPLLRGYTSYRLNFREDEIVQQVPFDAWTVLIIIMALVYAIATFFAWTGRPVGIFRGFQVVLVATLIAIGLELAIRYFGDYENTSVFFGTTDNDIFNRIFRAIFVFQLLIVVYILWYINRAPARAFYDQYKEQ